MEEYFQSSDFVLPCENHLKYFFFTGGVHSRCWICCIVTSNNKVLLATAHVRHLFHEDKTLHTAVPMNEVVVLLLFHAVAVRLCG